MEFNNVPNFGEYALFNLREIKGEIPIADCVVATETAISFWNWFTEKWFETWHKIRKS